VIGNMTILHRYSSRSKNKGVEESKKRVITFPNIYRNTLDKDLRTLNLDVKFLTS